MLIRFTSWMAIAIAAAFLVVAQASFVADTTMWLTFAVGALLAAVRAASGNIAACIGLHAGWVWVMLVARALSVPVTDRPLSFLLSDFDGFVGWLVLLWTIVIAIPLYRFYVRRSRLLAALDERAGALYGQYLDENSQAQTPAAAARDRALQELLLTRSARWAGLDQAGA